jgi:hypothetical protein
MQHKIPEYAKALDDTLDDIGQGSLMAASCSAEGPLIETP